MYRHLTVLMIGLLAAGAALAAVPGTINVQGRLLGDVSLSNGSHLATFRLHDAASAGVLLWSEDDTLRVVDGVFSAVLGRTSVLPTLLFSSGAEPWLEVVVAGITLSPRFALTTTPYAFWAQRADTAAFAMSAASAGDNLWSTDGSSVWRASGSVGIGTTSPDQMLRVNGMLGLGPTTWVEPTTRGLFLYHAGAGGGNLYAYDYTASKGDPLGLAGSKVVLGTYNAAGEFDGPKVTVLGNGNTGIGTETPDSPLDVRGSSQVADDDAPPDTRSYASLGVTRSATATNKSYLALTKVGTIPWGFGINSGSDLIIGVAEPNKTIPEPIVTVTRYPALSMTVNGSFVATGAKCRVVQGTAFGDLYFNATESAHALFTDDGEATIDGTSCHVELDARWLASVKVDEQHPLRVWITFTSEQSQPYYVRKGATGFDVVVARGAHATFDWQVQARQRGYEEIRLEGPKSVASR